MRRITSLLNPKLKWIAIITLLLFGLAYVGRAQKPVRIAGTYTNMYYNEEGGDVLGDEIKIVFTSGGYQGALQFAEGEPGPLIVVDVEVDGNKVRFSIPDSTPYPGQFTGKIERGSLNGEFRFKSGGSETVKLPRGKSYWD